jgi:hypothetical protein
MSLQNQQNLLAKLYTDAEFRRAFLSEPAKIGAENFLSETEIREIAGIMPEELNFFADSLFSKRLRQVEKFLPLTRKVLGEVFKSTFREFSQGFNPQTVKKHFEDAFEFCGYLQKQNISKPAINAVRFERAKLAFFGLERRIAVCRLDFDIRKPEFSDRAGEFAIPEKKIAVWLRIGKRVRHFFI